MAMYLYTSGPIRLASVQRQQDGKRRYASPEPRTELTTWIFEEETFVPSAKLVGDRHYSIISDYLGTPVEANDEEGQRVWPQELDISMGGHAQKSVR